MRKTCPWCGTELQQIPYLELLRKKPNWALLPVGIILFLASMVWVSVSKTIESVAFFLGTLIVLLIGVKKAERKKERQTPVAEMGKARWRFIMEKITMYLLCISGIGTIVAGASVLMYFYIIDEINTFTLSLTLGDIIAGVIILLYGLSARTKLKRYQKEHPLVSRENSS